VWKRVPVVVRAVIIGFVVLLAGNVLPQGLIAANLKSPASPWSAAPIAVYLWLYWQYVGGRWRPRSTSVARHRDLRAVPLSAVLWRWSLVAGALGIAALTTLTYALGRLVPLGLDFPEVFQQLPLVTLVTLVATISLMAGVVEEAAFRGYMQSRIERRYGPVVAILVVSVFFVLAHLPTSLAALPRMCLILIASVGYGILAYLSGSILPGLVLHAAGDIVGFGLLWLSLRGTSVTSDSPVPALNSPVLWANVAETVVLGILTVWAFRRLATASREGYRQPV
jgi:membrane protease YdiL (CAAX protease family)